MTQSFLYPELYCAGVLFSIFVIENWRRGIRKRPERIPDEPPDGDAFFFSFRNRKRCIKKRHGQ